MKHILFFFQIKGSFYQIYKNRYSISEKSSITKFNKKLESKRQKKKINYLLLVTTKKKGIERKSFEKNEKEK